MRRDDAAAPPRKCLPPYNSTVRREVKRTPASGGSWKMAEKKGERNAKRPCFLSDSMYNNPQQIKHPLFFKKNFTTVPGPMLYYLISLVPDFENTPLRLFNYFTFRAAAALITATLLGILLGKTTVKLLKRAVAPPRLEGIVAEQFVDHS